MRVSLSADTRTRTVLTPTKNCEERTIRIGPRTVALMEEHRTRQRVERMAAKMWEDPGWGFPSRSSRSSPGPRKGHV